MGKNHYGQKHPGSGTVRPMGGGPDYHPMPEGMIEYGTKTIRRQHTETVQNGLLKRLRGAPREETHVITTVKEVPDERQVIRKHYR